MDAFCRLVKRGFALCICLLLCHMSALAAAEATTTARVNLRARAALDAAVLKTVKANTAVDIIEFDPNGWSKVRAGKQEGYMKSEFLHTIQTPLATETSVTTKPADAVPLAQTVAEPIASTALTTLRTAKRVNFRAAPELTAKVLKTINAGVSITVETYDPLGWSLVVLDGVTGYIKSEYLTDSKVQDKGTVELLEWSVAKTIFTLNAPAQVYDVRSGLTYTVQSFSNGSHADVEPLTKADTEILHQTFDNRWQWSVRPVWVTINGHTMAASINGMPHGGGVIDDNGIDGQVCIHFLHSTTHNGNKSFAREHQNGVTEAWNAR